MDICQAAWGSHTNILGDRAFGHIWGMGWHLDVQNH